MDSSNEFIWLNIKDVSDEALHSFDSNNIDYNEYLYDKARSWQSHGEMATYVAVQESEYLQHTVTKIYAYSSISATGLMYDGTADRAMYLSCCEIRLFAIHKGLRGQSNDAFIPYSIVLFKSFLQDLYQMSTSVIGFKAIYLNSNDQGYHLYTDDAIGFMKPSGYIPASDEDKLNIDGCTPLLFFFDDDGIYKLFE